MTKMWLQPQPLRDSALLCLRRAKKTRLKKAGPVFLVNRSI